MSPAILYRQLPGEGLDAFIAEFRKAAARDPFGTVFIVPTSHLAREIVRRLREEDVPVVADTVTTLSGFARKIFLDYATSETLISGAESRLILARLLDAGKYPLLSGTGAVDELATLFEAILMWKVDYPAALDDLATARCVEIARLFDAYRRFLDEHDLVDERALFARVVRILSDTGWFRTVYIYGLFEPMPRTAGRYYARPPRTVFVYGLFEPMPLERDLLLSLRESAEDFHYSIPYARNPVVFADDGEWLLPDTVISGDAPDTRRSRLALLFSRAKSADCGGCIRLAERRDGLDEVRAIAQEIRDLVAAGVRPGEIAVAFPDLASALPCVEAVFPEFGVPYVASDGRPLSALPLVRALLDVAAVPARGYRREDVVALAASPFLPITCGCDLDLLSREARITAGAASWDEQFAALLRTVEDERDRPETPEPARSRLAAKAVSIASARDAVGTLFADLSMLDGTKTLADHIAVYRSLIERWQAPVMSKMGDPDLLGEFINLLASFERLARLLPEEKISLAEFSSLLAQLAAGTRTARRRNSGGVQVVGVREVAHLAVPYLFIGNLVEGVMPQLTTPPPFTADAGTQRSGARSREDILREERYYFTAALLSARSRIYLSYPATDGATPVIRSGFVDAVREAFSPGMWGNGDLPDSGLAAIRQACASIARGESVTETLRIPPALDPAAIPADARETTPPGLPLRDDIPTAVVPPGVPPNGEGERVYSASEIEAHLRGPAESRLPGFAAGDDALIRGLAVHEVFRGRDPAAVLRRHGLDPIRAPEYRELYSRFLASPLMQGIVRDHREVPFLVRVNGIAFRGVIDRLVQRLNGAWMLIDYKTGTPGDAADYAIQMTVYCHAAGQFLGSPVTPYLYFVDADRWAEIEVDEERVFAEIGRAVRGIEEENL
ncbi:PD-(D/E)XK nuclease family protein [Methanoculleus chikugoensis]|uniref:UvrD-like helicase C-terminal domain-containing protein n=1 Tax=Methanoculleus chikugoensis TaxID=118126 RepID=A0ABM7H6P7_9EURY|nr:PD-(D/E)XK nuclease family protein [Methanoculleus chikugoensis]BBL68483.1 hypothetical protein MchiMG62_16640 [Methanoculleus chikugoensis]